MSQWTRLDVFYAPQSTAPADTVAPTVSISSPSDLATVSGTVTITFTASDDVAVTEVQAKIDGIDVTPSDTVGPTWTYVWDTTLESEGAHTLGARAFDAAANIGNAPLIVVTVDNVPAPPPPPGSVRTSRTDAIRGTVFGMVRS